MAEIIDRSDDAYRMLFWKNEEMVVVVKETLHVRVGSGEWRSETSPCFKFQLLASIQKYVGNSYAKDLFVQDLQTAK